MGQEEGEVGGSVPRAVAAFASAVRLAQWLALRYRSRDARRDCYRAFCDARRAGEATARYRYMDLFDCIYAPTASDLRRC